MIFSKITVFILIIVIAFSIILANIAQQLDDDVIVRFDDETTRANDDNADSIISNSSSRLIWFLQISDIHISIFTDPTRITELEDFCSKTVVAIGPKVVLASGDLTDAKHKDNMGSAQYKKEWVIYNDVLNRFNIKNKTAWFDIRGNHDNFNVPNWNSSQNYFKEYSIQGPLNRRSYMHIVEEGGEKVAFIAVDACLEPGPRRPFNFMGMLPEKEVERLKKFIRRANDLNVDHIIWFGHYPSSCIFSFHDSSLRDVIGSAKPSKVYVCGHLHTLGGLVTEMYAVQRQGYLELELGDWKDNRKFRLLAIDHGLFSFIDNTHGEWPVILITNPKHNKYAMPYREPLHKMKHSTHIRLLSFSISPIDRVYVKIDDGEWTLCDHVNGPLYVLPWSPLNYLSGIHNIYAKVHDVDGREKVIVQPFSLDGTKSDLKMFPRGILMLNGTTVFQSLFATMILICIIPLLILRYMHHQILIGKSAKITLKRSCLRGLLRKLWLLSNVDCLFYPMVLFEIYLIFGPWFVGEVLEGHIGVIFSWGIIVDGAYIPGLFTYMYGFIQMFLCQLPLAFILANSADERFSIHYLGKRPTRSLFKRVIYHMPFIFVMTIQMVLAYFFWLAYGAMAFVIGPLRSWSIILNFYLWFKAITLTPESTREMTRVWIFSSLDPNVSVAKYQKS